MFCYKLYVLEILVFCSVDLNECSMQCIRTDGYVIFNASCNPALLCLYILSVIFQFADGQRTLSVFQFRGIYSYPRTLVLQKFCRSLEIYPTMLLLPCGIQGNHNI